MYVLSGALNVTAHKQKVLLGLTQPGLCHIVSTKSFLLHILVYELGYFTQTLYIHLLMILT